MAQRASNDILDAAARAIVKRVVAASCRVILVERTAKKLVDQVIRNACAVILAERKMAAKAAAMEIQVRSTTEKDREMTANEQADIRPEVDAPETTSSCSQGLPVPPRGQASPDGETPPLSNVASNSGMDDADANDEGSSVKVGFITSQLLLHSERSEQSTAVHISYAGKFAIRLTASDCN